MRTSDMNALKPLTTLSNDFMRLTNRLPVRVDFIPEHTNSLLHDHEFGEICLVTGGRARHLTSDGDEQLGRGSVLILSPGQVHGFSDTQDYGLVNIYYLAEWFLTNLQALQDIDHLVPLFFERALFSRRDAGAILHFKITDHDLESCLRDLSDLQHESSCVRPQPLYLEACFIKCLVVIARAYADSLATNDTPTGRACFPPAVTHALRQLERHAAQGESPDMDHLARECGLSLSYFCRLFKEHTGLSAGAYFQRRRIHRACHRLLTTSATITEIAHTLGYADSAHFSRFFKETTGLSPRDYRNKFLHPIIGGN